MCHNHNEAICIGETCPFGVASFCLTDFVLNSDLLSLKLNAPISAPTSRQYYEKLSKRISGSDWLSANTSLKILINISYPLYLDDAELSTITAKSLNTVISGDAYDGNSANNDDEAELQSELAYLSVRRRVCKSRVVRIVVVVE